MALSFLSPSSLLKFRFYKVAPTFQSADEILKCDHLMKATEQYFPVVLINSVLLGNLSNDNAIKNRFNAQKQSLCTCVLNFGTFFAILCKTTGTLRNHDGNANENAS